MTAKKRNFSPTSKELANRDFEAQLARVRRYEVEAGRAHGPGLPSTADNALKKDYAPTWGRAWITWPPSEELPTGEPTKAKGEA